MKEFSHSQIKDIYEKRIKKVVDYLNENSIGAAVFIDNESHREPAIRYFTGHPLTVAETRSCRVAVLSLS